MAIDITSDIITGMFFQKWTKCLLRCFVALQFRHIVIDGIFLYLFNIGILVKPTDQMQVFKDMTDRLLQIPKSPEKKNADRQHNKNNHKEFGADLPFARTMFL